MFPLKARVITLALVLALASAAAVWTLIPRSRQNPAASAPTRRPPPAPRIRRCSTTLSACGFPDGANTGVSRGTVLKTVPGQVTSGTGWAWNAATATLNVTGNGAVLTGLAIAGNLNITASNVTINKDTVTATGNYGISLRHTAAVTIENSSVTGQNATTGRVNYAIDDIYSDSTGLIIKNDNIADWRVGINATSGQVTANYIHDPGFLTGDHTDGIYDAEGTTALTVSGNTILNNIGQACDIMLQSEAGVPVSNLSVTGNLLAGGDYDIYAGGAQNDSTNITITNNRFGQQYYSTSGQYGPDAQYQASGTGNTWTGNFWDTTGTTFAP